MDKKRDNLKILKMIDKNEKHYTKKDVIADLPFRMVVVGKSQLSGKTNFSAFILLSPSWYLKDFEGDNIFIISGSVDNDRKLQILIEEKEIPPSNIYPDFDEELLEATYEMIEDEFKEDIEAGRKPKNYLWYLDDMSYKGDLKSSNFGIINKAFSNGRHINLSVLLTAQKYTDILTSARENMTMGIFFNCSERQLDSINDDINYLTDRKSFKKHFRNTCKEKHSFFIVNFSNDREEMYLDSNFKPIVMVDKNIDNHDVIDKLIKGVRIE